MYSKSSIAGRSFVGIDQSAKQATVTAIQQAAESTLTETPATGWELGEIRGYPWNKAIGISYECLWNIMATICTASYNSKNRNFSSQKK